jgi:hypothetical protein
LFDRTQKVVLTVAGLAAFALGGAALAGAASKTKAKTATTTTQSAPSMPRHGSAAHEDAEKPVTGAAAAQAQAAAEKSVGSGSTAGDVVSDFGGDGYEVTVTKADGSKVEVHLDKSFNVMQGHGGRHGGPRGDGPAGASFNGARSNGATTGA